MIAHSTHSLFGALLELAVPGAYLGHVLWRVWRERGDPPTAGGPASSRPMSAVDDVMDLRARAAALKARRVLPFPPDATPSAVADVMELRRARAQRRP